MSDMEKAREALEKIDPEQMNDSEPVLTRSDPEYVERPRGTRILAWVLLVLVIIGVILYCLWLAGILHE